MFRPLGELRRRGQRLRGPRRGQDPGQRHRLERRHHAVAGHVEHVEADQTLGDLEGAEAVAAELLARLVEPLHVDAGDSGRPGREQRFLDLRRRGELAAELLVRRPQGSLDVAALGHVAHRGDDQVAFVGLDRTQGDVDRELAPGVVEPEQVGPRAHRAHPGRPGVVGAVAVVPAARRLGDQDLDRPAHQRLGLVAEELLDQAVGVDDGARRVDDHHGVRRRLQQRERRPRPVSRVSHVGCRSARVARQCVIACTTVLMPTA